MASSAPDAAAAATTDTLPPPPPPSSSSSSSSPPLSPPSSSASSGVWLVFGARGWIGAQLCERLRAAGERVEEATCRLEQREAIERTLDTLRPAFVLNAAGKTGRPNVDWCETHQQETLRANVIGTLTLVDCCAQRGVHVTNLATGCIYSYDDAHPARSGRGFTEHDAHNFDGSFYSRTKGVVETLLASYSNVLTLRLRMPISDDLHPRSFVTKITRYERVVDVPNSMSVLHDLLPLVVDMTRRRRTGVYNFTNPGAVSHNEVLTLYRRYVDPAFTWRNFSLDEQALVLAAPRSNNELDCSKLLAEYPQLPDIHTALDACFQRMAKLERKDATAAATATDAATATAAVAAAAAQSD